MTDILAELKWETLQKRRKDNRLILLYKCLKGKARIPTDDLIPKVQMPINIASFLRHDLPDSLITSAEMSDDCVYK